MALNFPLKKKVKPIYLISGFLFLLVIFLHWNLARVQEQLPSIAEASEVTTTALNEPVSPIPVNLNLDPNKITLGQKLFYDTQLSSDNTVSCATCHDLKKGGGDGLVASVGMGKHQLTINSPTVFNSGFQFKQFWDGRAHTLEEQVDGPIQTVGEMGGLSWEEVIKRLKQSAEYKSLFGEIYAKGITENSIKDAIAEFEESLFTPNAPFDRYLRGDKDALTATEKQGYEAFKAYGCVTCHQGMLLGGNMFQTFGVMGDYFGDRGNVTKSDLGRYNVTGNERDRFVFKVPTLRNVALTAPYFHDGKAKSLDEAIKAMAKYQLGVQMPQNDVDDIMKFLRSLTGEYQGKAL